MSLCSRIGLPAASSMAYPPAIHQRAWQPLKMSATSSGLAGSHGPHGVSVRAMPVIMPRERRQQPHYWSYYLYGPLLYDLASAVMYVGGQDHAGELIQAYLREGVMDRAEVCDGLAPMLRFRWAVQANYFAWRIVENDLTGISGPQDNEKGLEDARRSLTF